jgi:hypothetical protein
MTLDDRRDIGRKVCNHDTRRRFLLVPMWRHRRWLVVVSLRVATLRITVLVGRCGLARPLGFGVRADGEQHNGAHPNLLSRQS